MPVALMFDGPSLGGFVCPATITSSDLWKMGQCRAGDGIRFKPTNLGMILLSHVTSDISCAFLVLHASSD